ncbi:MAG: hypothetical protein JO136_13715 [Hyphomicrobiales bacterium]|jgi:hypothetical protein|nr:hypothetical protein [Hyphomicrobiales bacterium]MBV9908653.1 hypothetical protein [Hyphomicrobiales bacterium]
MKSERIFEGQPVPAPILDKPVTRQTIFDRVVRHYRKQRRRCPAQGECLYRFGDDECFIGPLIGDRHYDPTMEGHPVRELMKIFAMPAWFRIHIDFIEELQRIHDNETNWGDGIMDMVLEMFAEKRGLEMPV